MMTVKFVCYMLICGDTKTEGCWDDVLLWSETMGMVAEGKGHAS